VPGDPDPFEVLYARGVTDGLPVVPPTAVRVAAAVEGSRRSGDELVALVAPRLGRATVEKIAINAVMAGPLLPWSVYPGRPTRWRLSSS
jgi:hypothetical protein